MHLLPLLFWLSLTLVQCLGPPNRSAQMIDLQGIPREHFHAGGAHDGGMYYTNLDTLRGLVLHIRNASLVNSLSKLKQILASNAIEGKLQREVPKAQPFPCDLSKGRSKQIPTNISQLRPGDIDIIAAFGDSTTAGNGILSQSWKDALSEFRGVTFIGGGLGNWRTTLTLPNILKLYNPKLYGYARGHGLVADKKVSVFNLAEPMLTIRDLPFQARVLIERMRHDPKVDMKKHWKLLTIFVGMNDICFELCNWDNTENYLRLQWKQLYQTMSMLRDNIPRLMISLILPPDTNNLRKLLKGSQPKCFMYYVCSCLGIKLRNQYLRALARLHLIKWKLAELKEFRRDDFVIVPHEILGNLGNLFMTNNSVDMRFYSHDCMHYSQRGHAILTSALWNSMLIKTDPNASDNWRQPVQHLHCPSEQQPFLRIR